MKNLRIESNSFKNKTFAWSRRIFKDARHPPQWSLTHQALLPAGRKQKTDNHPGVQELSAIHKSGGACPNKRITQIATVEDPELAEAEIAKLLDTQSLNARYYAMFFLAVLYKLVVKNEHKSTPARELKAPSLYDLGLDVAL